MTDTATVYKRTNIGVVLRLTLRDLGDGKVLVEGYARKRPGWQHFMRDDTHEGDELPFEKLRLNATYEKTFEKELEHVS